jgi:MFS family permease
MVIYSPIYLHEYIGFGWGQIGIIFAIMLLPFVILDFPLGKLSDKIGEKKMLIIGFIIISFSTVLIPILKEPSLWIWALILFATRTGAAMIEVMNESYFFKNITERNADEISFFRNAPSVAYVIAPLVAIPVLIFIPSFEYLFYVLGAILLFGLLNTFKLKDVK